jgi:hypothetical protein
MEIMKTFEQFFSDLTSDEIWFENTSKYHRPETFKNVVQLVYNIALGDREAMAGIPMREHRNHVVYKLNKIPPDKPKGKPWHVVEAEKIEAKEKEIQEKEWVPLTGEARAKKLQEWLDKVRAVEMQSAVPRVTHKEAIDEGGWLPKKDAPYPVTSKEEAYAKDRHLAYIIYAFEPRTAEKRPGVVSEEEFNISYDIEFLNKEGR